MGFAFRTPWGKAIYFLKIPLLSTSVPHRILFLPSFGFSLSAAFGLQELFAKKNPLSFHRLFRSFETIIFFILSTTLVIGLFFHNKIHLAYITSLRNSLIPSISFALFILLTKIYFFSKLWKLKKIILSIHHLNKTKSSFFRILGIQGGMLKPKMGKNYLS